MFRKTFRGCAVLGVLLVVALFLTSESTVLSRGATTSASSEKIAVYTNQTVFNQLEALSQPPPSPTPPPGHHCPPGHPCPPGHHCPRGSPTPTPALSGVPSALGGFSVN